MRREGEGGKGLNEDNHIDGRTEQAVTEMSLVYHIILKRSPFACVVCVGPQTTHSGSHLKGVLTTQGSVSRAEGRVACGLSMGVVGCGV